MQVHKDITQLPAFRNAVITIGTFDGVHTGHLRIIDLLKDEALRIGGETVIITFDPHPRMVVTSVKSEIKSLNTLDEKLELLVQHSIDHVVVVPFTDTFSQQTPEDYITDFIFHYFHPHTIIIGYDHHFGKDRKGNYLLLERYGEKLNFQVKEIPEHVLNEVAISSTRIRNALLGNDLTTARYCLGYDYFFEGNVVEGEKIGRTLGYPTANLEVNNVNKLIPGNGIYAVEVSIKIPSSSITNKNSHNTGETRYSEDVSAASTVMPSYSAPLKAMMNIGVRPTVGGNKRIIEVHILDYSEDLYGRSMRVFLKHFVRSEIKFNGLEELRYAITNDEDVIRKLLA